MAQKSKKITESGKDSPEKSPPSGGETELLSSTATLGSRDQQPPEKNLGSGEGTEADQQKGKKKGDPL